jgi:hypothetical protein
MKNQAIDNVQNINSFSAISVEPINYRLDAVCV